MDPTIQRRILIGATVSAAVATSIAAVSTMVALDALASELPTDGDVLRERGAATCLRAAWIAFAVTVPALGLLALAWWMPFAGVLHRFRRFLAGIVDGSRVEPLSLRRNDPMHDVATWLNAATEVARQRNADRRDGGDSGETARAA